MAARLLLLLVALLLIDAYPPRRDLAQAAEAVRRDSLTADLDGDGVAETALTLQPCPKDKSATCLSVRSPRVAGRDILISNTVNVCRGQAGFSHGEPLGARLRVIGDHVNDKVPEVSVLYCRREGRSAPPALAIVDLSAGTVVAQAVAPPDQFASFTDFARAPSGRLVPFLAPTYGDSNAVPSANAEATWGYMCIYSPDARAVSRCGPGFIEARTIPAPSFFREATGYMQDLDGDGWEDITLIFHNRIYTVSSRTGEVLDNLEYDVTSISEPKSPKGFHDGRNYGTHTAVTGADGRRRVIHVGGVAVGSFSDAFANVSRFVAVLESVPGRPAMRTMKWAKYFGFHSNSFASYDPKSAADPPVSRPADFSHGAIHRFGDSRGVAEGVDVIIVNHFKQLAPVDTCIRVQYQLYLPPMWTEEKQRNWRKCMDMNLKSRGVWAINVLRENDGSTVIDTDNAYVWGKTANLFPGSDAAYIVERLDGLMPYDLSDRTAGAMTIWTLNGKGWTARGTFPVNGRPMVSLVQRTGSATANNSSPFAELELEDVDSDGYNDIRLTDGRWVGYSRATRTFEVKAAGVPRPR